MKIGNKDKRNNKEGFRNRDDHKAKLAAQRHAAKREERMQRGSDY